MTILSHKLGRDLLSMKFFAIIIIFLIPTLLLGQSITLNSITMHGDGGTDDQAVISGETVSVSVAYETTGMVQYLLMVSIIQVTVVGLEI